MPGTGLTGSRIRERRIAMDLRQSVLAQNVGISASYLNLIEHNRRPIAGKHLNAIARELGVDAAALREGAEAVLLGRLAEAAAGARELTIEEAHTAQFAGRYPGWSALIGVLHDRNMALEHRVSALTDRITHDPELATSMHEVLSVVTAIRSAAAILAGTAAVDQEWQDRFHRNIYEDAQRLAASAQSLVEYLDATETDTAADGQTMPQEDLENWLAKRDYQVPEIEAGGAAEIGAVISQNAELDSATTTRSTARRYLGRYAADARKVPAEQLLLSISGGEVNPLALAQAFDCDLPCILRRLAYVGGSAPQSGFGLVTCDGSGTLTFRKQLDGFALPRFGGACPLWPMYQALQRPSVPIRRIVEQSGHRPRRFLTYAIAVPLQATGFDDPPVIEATMLILPEDYVPAETSEPVLPIGTNCRICPRTGCTARREPSILTDGF